MSLTARVTERPTLDSIRPRPRSGTVVANRPVVPEGEQPEFMAFVLIDTAPKSPVHQAESNHILGAWRSAFVRVAGRSCLGR